MLRNVAIAILGVLAMLASSQPATPVIDRAEEDWELVIRATDVDAVGPQITTTMCPGPLRGNPVANFNLNFRQGVTFRPGGLQIEVIKDKRVITSKASHSEQLETDGETITWTQKLSLSGGSATYRIDSGHSTTWGDFGGDDLRVTFDSELSDLSTYSPDISVTKSGVGWQSDHVTSMRLVRVRYYSGQDLIRTDETPRSIAL